MKLITLIVNQMVFSEQLLESILLINFKGETAVQNRGYKIMFKLLSNIPAFIVLHDILYYQLIHYLMRNNLLCMEQLWFSYLVIGQSWLAYN